MRPSTRAYDDDGTIRRTLSPAMRAVVLAVTALAGDVENPVRRRWVQPHPRYGPRHAVANVTPGSYRQDTHNIYGMETEAHLGAKTPSLGRYLFLTGRASASLVLL
jgi:hypothetical protein